jgi:hypothetical protein
VRILAERQAVGAVQLPKIKAPGLKVLAKKGDVGAVDHHSKWAMVLQPRLRQAGGFYLASSSQIAAGIDRVPMIHFMMRCPCSAPTRSTSELDEVDKRRSTIFGGPGHPTGGLAGSAGSNGGADGSTSLARLEALKVVGLPLVLARERRDALRKRLPLGRTQVYRC